MPEPREPTDQPEDVEEVEDVEPFSDQLATWLQSEGTKTVGDLGEVFAEKSFAVTVQVQAGHGHFGLAVVLAHGRRSPRVPRSSKPVRVWTG